MSTPEKIALIVQGETGLTVDRPAVLALYAGIEAQIAEFRYDLATEAGRKEAASLAYGIARKRTAIEADKKRLKEGLLAQGRAIDGVWNEIKEKLEGLQETARKPLTDWEEAEAARTALVEKAFASLSAVSILQMTDTSETVAALLEATEAYELNPDVFLGDYAEAMKLKSAAIASLKNSLAALRQSELDRAELAKLREATAAREKSDKEAAEAAEMDRLRKAAEERERVRVAEAAETARIAEEQRVAREKAAIEKAAKDAEEKARLATEEIAKLNAAKIEAAHQRELALAVQAKEEAERKAHNAKLAQELADGARIKEEKRKADELAAKAEAERKLAANKKHRQAIMDAASVAMIEATDLDGFPVKEEYADQIVRAIVDGKIPMCSLRFS